MEKLKLHSKNITADNIGKIADLFPNCITETQGENGEVKQAIDFDLLKQELSTTIVEGQKERYQLNWPGKREALLNANAPIAKTLRPCREESVDFDTTENLFIEGDNLDALKLLQETYLGKVKMIYIDPPYNTGNDGFTYRDNFAESVDDYLLETNQKNEDGNRTNSNTESNGRFHSVWLSEMYMRLKLSRNLLSDEGVIFISIDDNEQASLKRICDEIFGSENFLTILIWKSRQIIDSRNKNNASNDHEYVLIYSKEATKSKLRGKDIDLSKYKNPDNDLRGPWMSNSILGLANISQRPNLHYDITNPETGISYHCPPDTGWRYSKETMSQKISENRIVFPRKQDGRPREKKYLNELANRFTGFSSILPESAGYTLNGTREVRDLFDAKLFDFPKPVSLLNLLIQQGSFDKNDIILDFYAGSATTAHAVMQLNAEDKGSRKFIMVQLPEECSEKSEAFKDGYKTIAEISKERIRRAGQKIKEEDKAGIEKLDTGFRVLKIDSSNMQNVYYKPDEITQASLFETQDNIKADRTEEDLLFQVLLDWGVDLNLKIVREEIEGENVYFVDNNALAACFITNGKITNEICKKIAEREPLRVVFRDSGFANDDVKTNVSQIFSQLSRYTDIKVL